MFLPRSARYLHVPALSRHLGGLSLYIKALPLNLHIFVCEFIQLQHFFHCFHVIPHVHRNRARRFVLSTSSSGLQPTASCSASLSPPAVASCAGCFACVFRMLHYLAMLNSVSIPRSLAIGINSPFHMGHDPVLKTSAKYIASWFSRIWSRKLCLPRPFVSLRLYRGPQCFTKVHCVVYRFDLAMCSAGVQAAPLSSSFSIISSRLCGWSWFSAVNSVDLRDIRQPHDAHLETHLVRLSNCYVVAF